ncbi:MAG: HAD family hydrolase [Firmicutes bacterium]|nr:HAD family hydrolase [Bacillota bacterium]
MAVICFDYDGVIADTYTLEETYYLDIYKKRGITLFQTGEDLRNACRGNFYEFCDAHGLDHAELDAIFQEYNAFLKENHIEVPLFEGIPELLLGMLSKHTVYVVSLNDANVIEKRLLEEGISGFEEIIGWQQATSKKESLAELKARYGDDIYFISDSIGDMKEAVEADFPHILAVGYGWGDGADLLENGAHLLFDTVAELRNFLEKL